MEDAPYETDGLDVRPDKLFRVFLTITFAACWSPSLCSMTTGKGSIASSLDIKTSSYSCTDECFCLGPDRAKAILLVADQNFEKFRHFGGHVPQSLGGMMRFLHISDSTGIGRGGRYAKVRPLMNLLNERFVRLFSVQQEPSVDEAIICYLGLHPMFIRGKPICFGFRLYCCCSPSGYLACFEPCSSA